MVRKIIVTVFLLLLILSNIILVYENSRLEREHKKLLLFSRNAREYVQEEHHDAAYALRAVLTLENPLHQKALRSIYFEEGRFSIEIEATDMRMIQEMEAAIRQQIEGESPQMEISAEGGKIRASLIYGGMR